MNLFSFQNQSDKWAEFIPLANLQNMHNKLLAEIQI